ncbi:non-specific lipid-transfer protein 1-like [Lotus japonicus]|uniref:non-specific lipid-transfer protein 1-like n=1 Tax=Lotus japonicus TaxID=34305 RepID=UPI00259111E9|nr:non-specific lipid-transfer protein 1-like [Lotus japonicus]
MAAALVLKFASLAVMVMVLGSPFADAALPCGQLTFTVAPCIGYLRNPTPTVPAACCNGIRDILRQAKTVPDRQGVCRCLKSTVYNLPGINLPALASVPGKCGAKLSYKISPSIDCNTVN